MYSISHLTKMKKLEDSDVSPTLHMGDIFDLNRPSDKNFISLDRLEYILTKISENSMIWDAGLQMLVLKKLNCEESYSEVTKWSKKILCPCGHNHRKWFQNQNIAAEEFSEEGICKGLYHAIKLASLFKIAEMFDSFGSISLYVFDVSGVF